MEQFKDIKGYEGIYQVSNYGRVKRLTRTQPASLKDSGYRTLREKMLTPLNSKGYHRVNLQGKLHLVHRLVAQTFIDNPNEYPMVMHLDNNKTNNHVDNLQWGSNSMNQLHSVESGTWNNQYTI